jgi:ABC-type molybdenum transport system ATPase subunit/photorepair protein PhrA
MVMVSLSERYFDACINLKLFQTLVIFRRFHQHANTRSRVVILFQASGSSVGGDNEAEDAAAKAAEVLAAVKRDGAKQSMEDDGIDFEAADALAQAGTICIFSASRKGVDARSRDINVQNFSLQHMGSVLLDESQIILNHGNRYGLIGRNGCGKSTLLRAIGARAVPLPRGIDIYYLSEEIEPSDTMTALDAVMSVDEERMRLDKQADDLNQLLAAFADKAASGDLEHRRITRLLKNKKKKSWRL